MNNILGRELPEEIEGYGIVHPYEGAFAHCGEGRRVSTATRSQVPGVSKVLSSLQEAILRTGLQDGMTVSFHHHLRNGDKVVNLVMAEIAALGIKDIHLAASGLFACHEPLIPLMEQGVITKISTDTFNPSPIANAITAGKLQKPAVLMSHGGRPRAIESGSLHIDVAFIAAPTADSMGNLNGTHGPSACGYLSYAYPDARYADYVVAVTDNLLKYPICPIEISQELVDYIVQVESIGDPNGIVSGSIKVTEDTIRLGIAEQAAEVIDCAGYLKEGMSFQTGASTTSLAVAAKVRQRMIDRKITGSFCLGGIHAYMVKMLEEGLFRALLDVQCFDLDAVASARRNESHMSISASQYANPDGKSPAVNSLDTVILGATEIDLDYNVNVITGSNGVILGASGGHQDCAAGSKLTVIVSNLMKKNRCLIKEKVTTVTTPGDTIDVLVTEYGIAVNPRRIDLLEYLQDSGLPLVTIQELRQKGLELGAVDDELHTTQKIVAVVEYRDGTVLDLVRQPVD